MPISGVTEDEYLRFLAHGGTLTFHGLNAIDIDSTAAFEKNPRIEPQLSSGFELAPSLPLVDDPISRAPLLLYGGSWTRVVVSAYGHGGRIIYKRKSDGSYQADVAVPSR